MQARCVAHWRLQQVEPDLEFTLQPVEKELFNPCAADLSLNLLDGIADSGALRAEVIRQVQRVLCECMDVWVKGFVRFSSCLVECRLGVGMWRADMRLLGADADTKNMRQALL